MANECRSRAWNRMTGAQAMILAAGRGERMRPLTDNCPKPLLKVRGKPLIQYHVDALWRAGWRDLVVNTAWLGDQIEDHFALSSSLEDGPRIRYSHEGRDFGGALETAGGIARALPLLDDAFWLVGGDVFVPGFEFTRAAMDRFVASGKLAHVYLVPNPQHNPKGDFGLQPDGVALNRADTGTPTRPSASCARPCSPACPPAIQQGLKVPLAPLLREAMDNGEVTAEIYTGHWTDVGTPERLSQLNAT